MKYIEDFHEGDRISGIYLCKQHQSATTKNGKQYDNVILADRSGTIDAKIWDPNSSGIGDFDAMDYVEIGGEVTTFAGSLQLNIRRARRASEGEYDPADYLPVSEYDIPQMYQELIGYIAKVKEPHLQKLLRMFFTQDPVIAREFQKHSAAKTVHHSFVGGLLQHTLAVTKLCEFYINAYPMLNGDLLYTAAMLHDIGKIRELSDFPINDYTDEGQLLGHIMMGTEMIHEKILLIEDFPVKLGNELKHCILAHHGELEYGSPKKPALMEAVALNMADNTDAKLETMTEIMKSAGMNQDWLGYNKLFESNLRRTSEY